jgi:hypothetical protein
MRDFALAQDKWYSTWPTNPEDRAMVMCVLAYSLSSLSPFLAVSVFRSADYPSSAETMSRCGNSAEYRL